MDNNNIFWRCAIAYKDYIVAHFVVVVLLLSAGLNSLLLVTLTKRTWRNKFQVEKYRCYPLIRS